jgi:hypothetical protein
MSASNMCRIVVVAIQDQLQMGIRITDARPDFERILFGYPNLRDHYIDCLGLKQQLQIGESMETTDPLVS